MAALRSRRFARSLGFDDGAAFDTAFRHMKNRIGAFINLPMASLDRMALSRKLRDIGQMDGATTRIPQE